MSTKTPAKRTKPRQRKPTVKQLLTAEGIAQGKSAHRAALDAGYSPSTAKTMIYKPLENSRILEAVERRKAQAMKRAQIHTDVIVGSLAEIATASLGDVLNDEGEFSINIARENGVDHLLKKVKVKVRSIPNGSDRPPDIETTYEYEMYDRLNALNQLRDNFGMKQEARPYNAQAEIDEAVRDFIEKAQQRGHVLTYDEARTFIEPRMANNFIN